MKADNFTEKLVEGLNQAKSFCENKGYQEVGPAIMAKVLIEQPEGLVGEILKSAGSEGAALIKEIDQAVEALPKVSGSATVYFSPTLEASVNKAQKLAASLGDTFIATDTFFLGLLEAPSLSPILKRA